MGKREKGRAVRERVGKVYGDLGYLCRLTLGRIWDINLKRPGRVGRIMA